MRTCERILRYAQKVLWRPSVEQALVDLRTRHIASWNLRVRKSGLFHLTQTNSDFLVSRMNGFYDDYIRSVPSLAFVRQAVRRFLPM